MKVRARTGTSGSNSDSNSNGYSTSNSNSICRSNGSSDSNERVSLIVSIAVTVCRAIAMATDSEDSYGPDKGCVDGYPCRKPEIKSTLSEGQYFSLYRGRS